MYYWQSVKLFKPNYMTSVLNYVTDLLRLFTLFFSSLKIGQDFFFITLNYKQAFSFFYKSLSINQQYSLMYHEK